MPVGQKRRMPTHPISFDIAPQVLDLGIRGVYFTIRGITNRPEDPDFERLKAESLQPLLPTLSRESLRADPVLQGFRDLHTRIGFSNRNFVAASESLLETLSRTGRLPQINLVVDIYNLVSVETRLALGAHDIARISGNAHLRLLDGSERFWPLGAEELKPVRAGGYAYVDGANEVICMLEVLQVEKTKVTLDTRDVLYIVQGNPATDMATLRAAAERVIQLTQQYCGGEAELLYPPQG